MTIEITKFNHQSITTMPTKLSSTSVCFLNTSKDNDSTAIPGQPVPIKSPSPTDIEEVFFCALGAHNVLHEKHILSRL